MTCILGHQPTECQCPQVLFLHMPFLSSLSNSLSNAQSFLMSKAGSWGWWHLPITLALGRQREENFEFKASHGPIERSCLNKTRAGLQLSIPVLTHYGQSCGFDAQIRRREEKIQRPLGGVLNTEISSWSIEHRNLCN